MKVLAPKVETYSEGCMRRIWAACVVVVLGIISSVALAEAAEPQWEIDGALIGQVVTETRAGGIGAVAPHAAALKKALAGAKVLFPGPIKDDGTSYVLTDGSSETVAVLVKMTRDNAGEIMAFDNPYPIMGLILGSFYVETGEPKEALEVLDAGLTLSPLPEDRLGRTVPDILAERGIALGQLKRWKESLASYEAGLAVRDMDKSMRAVLHRGRGFALIEMERLDDAEAAYKTSLKFAPGNELAKKELAYIASLQAGAKPLDQTLISPGAGKK